MVNLFLAGYKPAARSRLIGSGYDHNCVILFVWPQRRRVVTSRSSVATMTELHDHLKLLFWDRDGYCIWHKRLERGTFQLLTVAGAEGIELSYAQLVRLLGGLDLTTGRRRKRWFGSQHFSLSHSKSFTLTPTDSAKHLSLGPMCARRIQRLKPSGACS